MRARSGRTFTGHLEMCHVARALSLSWQTLYSDLVLDSYRQYIPFGARVQFTGQGGDWYPVDESLADGLAEVPNTLTLGVLRSVLYDAVQFEIGEAFLTLTYNYGLDVTYTIDNDDPVGGNIVQLLFKDATNLQGRPATAEELALLPPRPAADN